MQCMENHVLIQETGVHIVYPFVGLTKKCFCVFHLSGNSLTPDTMNSIPDTMNSTPFNSALKTFSATIRQLNR